MRQALKWFQDVVDKRTLQMLPGCATVVLETVMEMHQILANYCISNTRLGSNYLIWLNFDYLQKNLKAPNLHTR